MSFTVTKNHQVPWYEFPQVEKQLRCSSQCFLVSEKLDYIVELCERFASDFWFVGHHGGPHSQKEYVVGFIAPKDVVSFKTFFTSFEAHEPIKIRATTSNFAEDIKNRRLRTFSLNFLRRLEGYAQRRKDKTVKFKLDIYTLADVQTAILEKSIQEIKWMEQQYPELDGIPTRRLLQYYRQRQDPVFVHTVGDIPRRRIKQVLDTREHVEGSKPSWN